jgi:hypothetical protein
MVEFDLVNPQRDAARPFWQSRSASASTHRQSTTNARAAQFISPISSEVDGSGRSQPPDDGPQHGRCPTAVALDWGDEQCQWFRLRLRASLTDRLLEVIALPEPLQVAADALAAAS